MDARFLVLVASLCALAVQGVVPERRFKPRTYRYPAPREVLSLDGEWEYRFPKDRRKPADSFPWEKVQTPYVGSTYYATMWVTHSYRRMFTMPALAGRRAIIHFECIPCVCEVTFNGRLVFVHGPGGIPFDVDVTDVAKEGENSIRLDVRIPKDGELIKNGGPWQGDAPWVVGCLMGYLRPVYLELRPRVSVEDVVITTRVAGGKRIEVRAELTNATSRARSVTVDGRSGGLALGGRSLTLPPGGGASVTLEREWPDAALWTPDDPNLHFLDIEVKEGGRVVDARRERFGFREITWKGDKVFLNGMQIMLKRSCDSQAEESDDTGIAKSIERLKRRGVNGVRVSPSHVARWVDAADENGFFVSATISSNKAKNYRENSWKWWKEENLAHVKAYRNHPSVIAWGIGGEMGYVYGLTADKETNKALVAEMQDCGLAVAALDPTRPWVCHGDNEVAMPGTTKGPATIRTWHYPKGPSIENVCLPESAWWYKRREKSWQSITDREKPICIGEDLYHGLHDQFFCLAKWGGDSIWTLDGYLTAWRDCVWMFADGYYDGDLAGWNLWSTADGSRTNRLYDVITDGQLMPDYLVSIREPFRNLRSGVPEKRTLTVYNKRFRDRRVRLVREGAGSAVDEWEFTVPAGGRHVMEVEVRGDCGAKPKTYRHRYTLSDAQTGERLFVREWTYNAFPARSFKWPNGVVVVSNGVKSVEAAIASGMPIVVTRPLGGQEGKALKRHVAGGGKVMIAGVRDGWQPLTLLGSRPQSFVFRRTESAFRGVTDDMLACWRPDSLVGDCGYVKPADRTVHVLLDSGHRDGLNEMQAGWLWDGEGRWLLLQLPVFGENRDAAADWVLACAMYEFLSGGSTLGAKLVLSDDDPIAPVWRNGGLVFETAADASAVGKPGIVLGVSLAESGAEGRWASAKEHARRGGTVFVHSVSATNAHLLADLGLSLKPLDACAYVTRLTQGGLMDGVSNDDLYFTHEKLGDVKFIYENKWNKVPKNRKFKSNDLLSGALEGKGVVTEPGALADVSFGKGRVVVSTVKWESEWLRHPKKTGALVRNLLRCMGVNASGVAPETAEAPLRISKSLNRPLWNDPRLKGAAKAWFGGEDDMRYFPVNLCGWSRDSGNWGTVEEVPTDPIRYAGHGFLVCKSNFHGVEMPGAIVLEPGEKTRLEIWQKGVKAFLFLGALAEHKKGMDVLKVSYGYRDKSRFEAKAVAGDHVNGYKWAGEAKSGVVGWTGYSKDELQAALYCWRMQSDKTEKAGQLVSFVELENIGPVPIAIVSVTAECGK